MPESTESLIRGIEGRIIRMETLLEGISAEMKKGDEKFRRLEQENAEIKGELAEILGGGIVPAREKGTPLRYRTGKRSVSVREFEDV